MTPDRCRVAPRRRSALTWCLLLVVAGVASGCRFLADEFAWLDRRAPATERAPDAPVSGLAERP